MAGIPSQRRLHLRFLTQAGNATALVWLALVLAHAPLLFGPPTAAGPGPAPRREPAQAASRTAVDPPGGAPARRVLLVVIDALRDDVARDPRRMPELAALARRGGRGTARVESPIPSTIAGLRTLVEGAVPPPASFLQDFRADPAAGGGLFAAVGAAGGRSFTVGPRLWSDLYGRWIARAVTVPTLHGDDRRVEQAAIAALRAPDLRLLVVHFGEPDDAAHLIGALEGCGGAAGNPYLDAVRRADAALGRLAAAAGPQTAVLVTADHGVTDRGGHAGPEPEVLAIPVVTAGPGMPRGPLQDLRQSDLRHLVETALGLAPPVRPTPTVRSAPSTWNRAWNGAWNGAALLLAGLATLAAAAHLGAAHAGRVRGWGPLLLDLCFWSALALLLLGWRGAALAVVLGALAAGGFAIRPEGVGRSLPPHRRRIETIGERRVPPPWEGGGWIRGEDRRGALRGGQTFGRVPDPERPPPGLPPVPTLPLPGGRDAQPRRFSSTFSAPIFAVLAAGLLAGFLRLADGAWTALGTLPLGWSGAGALLGACLLAAAFGAGLGRATVAGPRGEAAALAAGVAAALIPALCARLLGETVSLSTLDVRLAFRLAEGPLGLPGAALAATLRAVLPALCLAAGLAPALRGADPAAAGRFYAGLGAGLCGQALAAALLLAVSPAATLSVSLATGQLVRLFGEMSFLFLGCAAAAALRQARRAAAHSEPAAARLSVVSQ